MNVTCSRITVLAFNNVNQVFNNTLKSSYEILLTHLKAHVLSANEVFDKVDFYCVKNNSAHRTIEISRDKLTVRRGQSFNVTLNLRQAFDPLNDPLKFTAITGNYPSEDIGTMSLFGVPDNERRSTNAKAVWKAELQESYSLQILNLTITPPADAPIGEYIVMVGYKNEETLLGELVVLYNPWCSDDWVFLPNEDERQEYVMNESGILYKGSGNYIMPSHWDFGQFEDRMVEICMNLLDLNPKHLKDPSDDVSARCNPIYVSRVVSAMINSADDHGVLQGRWSGSFAGGVLPSHWTGSYAILRQWLLNFFRPVKYGQCWVFAAVMCSVMRLLGIPCRVVTNFQSAHDRNQNLTIDVYHADYGVRERPTRDSVWNYHVWVEAWMRRPDLAEDGRYDGWQVLDPTPQERSDGVYCCGPAPVKAILKGETHLKYDVPFVFAEVNADCVDWLVKADGSKITIWTDTQRVGQNISTKGVGTNDRMIITKNYKYKEGSSEERAVFSYACTRDCSSDCFEVKPMMMMNNNERTGNEERTPISGSAEITVNEESTCIAPVVPPLTIQFEEVSIPTVGADVSMNLLLQSPPETTDDKTLSITISIQSITYNCESSMSMKQEVKEEKLLAGKDLSIPILIPFKDYRKHLLDCDTIKVSAVIADKQNPEEIYYAEQDIVLQDPPMSVTVSDHPKQDTESSAQVIFKNPIDETLTGCSLTVSGSGLFKEEVKYKTPDMKPNTQIVVTFFFNPYKSGKKTLMVNFGCSIFRDITGSCTVDVKPPQAA
ncbi:Protein-glutamine gamma-glutamyltransferase E [Larimichthys crocea]|uniref:Uncharacterized protein n=1 Tax=Larimichthys crocea TaxID=215358 RepID=A0ACD3RI92_LARCR|nr:Protein-glutamine gamma-glutamyltransferase E [Larimichthys crocea]